jgi:tetratricopeptide (TPR) repeat protein
VLENREPTDITDLKLSVFIKGFMDSPKITVLDGALARGQSRKVDLFALFNTAVLDITEGTKVSAEVAVEYSQKAAHKKATAQETVRLNHRNASLWDDDRRAAAFVTARDPAVLRFSKASDGLIRSQDNQAVDHNLRSAMAMHQALSLYGMRYVVDPKSAYAEAIKNKLQLDFLQFPRQTLSYKAGDCDDLSILYSALLESVGIETAFVTVPGHIFLAFALDLNEAQARRIFLRPEDLIVAQGKVWVPVEVTETQGGFLKAWAAGAKQWRENSAAGQASFYPLSEAWKTFEPVGLPGEGEGLVFPASKDVEKSYAGEFDRFLHREVDDRAAALEKEAQKSGDSPSALNKLGLLYARFGMLSQAEKQFRKAVARQEYLPALVNLGNVLYLKRDFPGAMGAFDRARKKEPKNPSVLLNIARILYEQEKYDSARQSYEALAAVDPQLAKENRYLALQGDATARAANAAAQKEKMIWQE